MILHICEQCSAKFHDTLAYITHAQDCTGPDDTLALLRSERPRA